MTCLELSLLTTTAVVSLLPESAVESLAPPPLDLRLYQLVHPFSPWKQAYLTFSTLAGSMSFE
jgi:hypothetical protein